MNVLPRDMMTLLLSVYRPIHERQLGKDDLIGDLHLHAATGNSFIACILYAMSTPQALTMSRQSSGPAGMFFTIDLRPEWHVYRIPDRDIIGFTRRPIEAEVTWPKALSNAFEQVQAVGGPQEYAALLEATVQQLVGQTIGTQEKKKGEPRTNFCPRPYELDEFFIKTSSHQGAYWLISA
ncbi:hypothetical protein C6P46_003157 [Rhodotorula mucilaginosa]|uniref:Uncharacterized protein n=1 Tax=Rhodotorula mucilaginosa TaxID=5537 RepID=A0A9P6W3A2_RHOMI|nr:hypothetical protein C6P46_003157 [Rhodotorula mucilaginosa]